MPRIYVDQEQVHDRRIRIFAGAIGLPAVHALGHIVALWGWASRHTENGNVADCSAADLSTNAHFTGDPERFKSALVSSGILTSDGYFADWKGIAGAILSKLDYDKKRQESKRDAESLRPSLRPSLRLPKQRSEIRDQRSEESGERIEDPSDLHNSEIVDPSEIQRARVPAHDQAPAPAREDRNSNGNPSEIHRNSALVPSGEVVDAEVVGESDPLRKQASGKTPVNEACDDWTEIVGGAPPGARIAKAIGTELLRKMGLPWAEVRRVWRGYLSWASHDAEYCNPQDFAAKYGAWKRKIDGEALSRSEREHRLATAKAAVALADFENDPIVRAVDEHNAKLRAFDQARYGRKASN